MLEYPENHRFRKALDPKPGSDVEAWDRRVAETSAFIAIPTMGAIVPGWILIVPRRRVISFAALTKQERAEFRMFRDVVIDRVKQVFSAPTVFEHGAGYTGSLMGCGLDHAHSHIVPLDFDLIRAVQEDDSSQIEWKKIDNEEEIYYSVKPGENYMSIFSPTGRKVYASRFFPVSQYLRKLVALHVGVASAWDYRSNPFEKNVIETFARLQEVR